MTYSLSLRPRALAELVAASERYALVGHGDAFLDEVDSVFEAIQAMPLLGRLRPRARTSQNESILAIMLALRLLFSYSNMKL
jgi:hypothetical protein